MNRSKYFAEVGRIQKYLENPKAGVSPASCTIADWPSLSTIKASDSFTQITDFALYLAMSLKYGAGINIHLNNFDAKRTRELFGSYVTAEEPTALFYLSPEHVDYERYKEEFSSLSEVPRRSVVTLSPEDSLESIIIHVVGMMQLLSNGYNVVVDLSKLREEGNSNTVGMVASGPASFLNIYKAAYRFWQNPTLTRLMGWISSHNQEIRRGGVFKNGAVTTSLLVSHDSLEEYLTASPVAFPWLKRGLTLVSDVEIVLDDWEGAKSLILAMVNEGLLWLEKAIITDGFNNNFASSVDLSLANWQEILQHNVCREVLIKMGETCTISPVNLGMIEDVANIPQAMMECMEILISIHQLNGPSISSDGMYADADQDKQIGLGFIGLANLLAHHGVTYGELVRAFDSFDYESYIKGAIIPNPLNTNPSVAMQIAYSLASGINDSAVVARQHGYKRAFAIAPTATSSFRHVDFKGYTTTPNIQPALAPSVERISDTLKMEQVFTYPPNVALMKDVGYDIYYALACHFQRMMNATGMAHAISFDLIEDMTEKRFDEWFSGPLTSTYYRIVVGHEHLDKSDQFNKGCQVCGG